MKNRNIIKNLLILSLVLLPMKAKALEKSIVTECGKDKLAVGESTNCVVKTKGKDFKLAGIDLDLIFTNGLKVSNVKKGIGWEGDLSSSDLKKEGKDLTLKILLYTDEERYDNNGLEIASFDVKNDGEFAVDYFSIKGAKAAEVSSASPNYAVENVKVEERKIIYCAKITDPEVNPDPEIKPNPGTNPEVKPNPGTNPEANPDPGTNPEIKPNPDKPVENPETGKEPYAILGIITLILSVLGYNLYRKKDKFLLK